MAKNTLTLSFGVERGDNGINKLKLDLKEVADAAKKLGIATKGAVKFDIAAATTSLQNFGRSFTQINDTVRQLTESYVSFDSAMRKANTMASKSGADYDELKNKVKDLGKTIGLTREQLAEGLYQTVSNGVDEGQWFTYLETSAKSAVGGVADLGKEVGAISGKF